MSQHPEISYTHVLSELSVNRKDPCEIIRELISNSYDAQASIIEIYPLLQAQYQGFIFFDNGDGLSETKVINDITPYKAFFSIGKSTKSQGEFIGYKCQGSKLCFASKKMTLITRCSDEENWRSISIDNPKENLHPKYNIESAFNDKPWETLKSLFARASKQTLPILEHLNEKYFMKNFCQGTMIIVQGLEVDKFAEFYDSYEDSPTKKWSYLKNYIRFNTRHGDMRILKPSRTGFPDSKAENFKTTQGYNENCNLFLWANNHKKNYSLELIDAGYPYLDQPNELDKMLTSSPAKVASLNSGKFCSRGAKTFHFEGITYCVVLAIDGRGRTLDKYKELGRKGDRRSGIRLIDQRGVFICSDGVKICQYYQLFEHSKLEDYSVLGTSNGQSHYILMINGTFDVVTNRNSLADNALKVINNEAFIDEIKKFLDAEMRVNQYFNELVDRLNKDNHDVKLDTYTKNLNKLKQNIQNRPRFMIQNVEQLKDKWLIEPDIGEEHLVGALYTMFAHLVPTDSQYTHLWLRPRTFSAMGIDSIAVNLGENSFAENIQKALEYKYAFSSNDEFNHPLILTEQIVCWDLPKGKQDDPIYDSYNYFGSVDCTKELDGLGYEIVQIMDRDSGDYYSGKVKVISLKNILEKTFDYTRFTPPPKITTSKSKKSTRR